MSSNSSSNNNNSAATNNTSSNSAAISRKSSLTGSNVVGGGGGGFGEIKSTVKDYIELLREGKTEEEFLSKELALTSLISNKDSKCDGSGVNEEIADSNGKTDSVSTVLPTETASSESQQQLQRSFNNGLSKRRHLHLPPIVDLESYVLGDGEENFLNVLPDISEAIASYLTTYPDQVRFVWQNIKPILRDIRKRNRLHGRHLIRPSPPICKKVPSSWNTVHGDVINDDYAWLTDKDDPEVMQYLVEENRYADQCLSHTKTLQKVLFKEFVSRLDESAVSARVTLLDGWQYFSKKIPNAEYRLHCRVDRNGFEEVYLDENELAESAEITEQGASFFHMGFLKHSVDGNIIAYGIDGSGSERYIAHIRNMESKLDLPEIILDCSEDFEFSTCGNYAFYVGIDEYARAYQVKRHKIGTNVSEDVVIYEEPDEMFYLTMTKSCNNKYLIINSSAQVTSETRLLKLSNPLGTPFVLFTRREKVQYTVEHHSFDQCEPDSQEFRGYFYVSTNEKSRNIKVFRVPVPKDEDWLTKFRDGISIETLKTLKEVVIENRDFVLIEAFQVRARHLIVFERSNCMQNIRIVNLEVGQGFESYHYVSFSEATVYSVWPGSVDEEVADLSKSVSFDTNILRFTYTSFIQPKQVVEYNMDTRIKSVVHEERVMGPGYDKSLYVSKRLWATGTDGTAVPMSIVYRKDLLGLPSGNAPGNSGMGKENNMGLGIAARGTGNPTLLHAYGAYGYSVSPIFNSSRLGLLDRGFIFAVAHVRGGSEMGNAWYEEGKLAKKQNTFTDFISCAEFLIKEGYTSSEKLAIYGRSAGGLLIGAVLNKRPDLFKSALTEVPFVDVINTMFDTTIPWTAFEFEEWGNPADIKICNIMKSYCPYSNVVDGGTYPNMLVVAGMNDPRVAYFEPAKWTAKLRSKAIWNHPKPTYGETGTDSAEPHSTSSEDRILLLKIQDAGHSGSSGQYSHLDDLAFEYAFLISTLGAQFKPYSSGGKNLSLNGVDYDVYWNELENDDAEEEDYEEFQPGLTTNVKAATPLQRFSAYWRRKSIKRDKKSPGKDKRRSKPAREKEHSRNGSLGGVKGLFRGLSRGSSDVTSLQIEDGETLVRVSDKDAVNHENPAANALLDTQSEEVVEELRDTSARLPDSFERVNGKIMADMITNPRSQSGSKASLRHQLYPMEEEKTTGKGYNFWSKFF